MHLKNSKTIVIKIGSSLIINDRKIVRKKWLSEFARDIKELLNQKKNIIIVSSGAIALGCKKLELNKKNLKLDKSQAVASIGQIELMNLFKKTFNLRKINLSQILLTLEDTEQRRRAINAKRTFENLFKLEFVPVVNENDSIATSEIKYGDNDRLASRVAQISGADCLILLSDVDGLYTKNPKIYKDAKIIKEINNIDLEIEKVATKSVGEHGTGGMKTKIDAAKICQLSGCTMAIANGLTLNPIICSEIPNASANPNSNEPHIVPSNVQPPNRTAAIATTPFPADMFCENAPVTARERYAPDKPAHIPAI